MTSTTNPYAPIDPRRSGYPAAGPPDGHEERITRLDERVEHLQRTKQQARPWYRQASTVIAVIALLLSAGSTYVSESRAQDQSRRDARSELGQLIERINAQPTQQAELDAQYAKNAQAKAAIGSALTSERMVLSQQAADVIARIPEQATGTEYYVVTQALLDSGLFQRAEALGLRGLAVAGDLQTNAAIYRVLAVGRLMAGDGTRADAYFQRAVDLFADQPPELRAQADGLTYVLWSTREWMFGDCADAVTHEQLARRAISEVAFIPLRDGLQAQLDTGRDAGGLCSAAG